MSTREIHNYELSDEALLDFASNWEDSGAELASQSTPVTPANQQPHIQTNQPVQSVQLQQQNTIATARSIPHNVNFILLWDTQCLHILISSNSSIHFTMVYRPMGL